MFWFFILAIVIVLVLAALATQKATFAFLGSDAGSKALSSLVFL